MKFTKELIEQALFRMDENTERIRKCLEELSEEELWKRPNAASNSVGNLLLHLSGNITQYIISSLGKIADKRTRDAEFDTTSGYDKAALWNLLETTVNQAQAVIKALQAAEILNKRSVQGFEFSAIGIILHVVEHYSYHTGQIAFWVKLLKDKDLKFYGDMDLNVKNELE